jgi:hypothetical protein
MILKHNAGKVFMDPHRFRVLKAGRRFGKTFEFIAEIERSVAAREGEIWYLAPTYRQAKEIFWEPLKSSFPVAWLASHPNETELSLKCINGIHVKLKGADNFDSLRGKGLALALLDEFDYMDERVWPKIIRPMLATSGGRAVFSGTPDGKKQLAALFERGQSIDPKDHNWASWKFTTLDGGWVPETEIEEIKTDMDEQTFLQEHMAEDILASGTVYYAFGPANVRPCPPDLKTGPVSCGMDFNTNPWMSAAVFATKGEEVFFLDDIIIPRGNTMMMVDEIRTRYGDRLKDIYPDPAGRHPSTKAAVGTSDFSILEKAGFRLHSRLSTLSVKNGINAVNSRLCSMTKQRKMFVDPALVRKNASMPPRMIDCLEQHCYKKGTSIPEEDDYKHLLDGCRYAMEFLFPIREQKEWSQ